MADQAQRINATVRHALADAADKLAPEYGSFDRESIGYAVGHFFGTVPIPDGTAYLGPAWIITLTMRNPLLGNPDIAPAMPIPGAMPTDNTIRQAVTALLAESRQADRRVRRPAHPGPRPVPGGLGHPRRRRRDRDPRPQRRAPDPRRPPGRALAPPQPPPHGMTVPARTWWRWGRVTRARPGSAQGDRSPRERRPRYRR